MKIDRVINEYKARRTARILARLDSARYDYDRPTEDYDWITIRGQHTPIDDGHIVGGIGGKFKGKAYTGNKMQQSKKRAEHVAKKAASSGGGSGKTGIKNSEVAQKIRAAKTFADAKRIFTSAVGVHILGTGEVKYGKIKALGNNFNTPYVKEGLAGLSDMFQEFPKLKETITGIGSFSIGGAFAVHTKVISTGEEYISFVSGYFTKSNIEKLERTIARQVETGYWPKNSTVAGAMVHEIGHGLVSLISKQDTMITKSEYCTDIVMTAAKNVNSSMGTNISVGELRRTISGQAADRDPEECISEAFAECYDNGENASPMGKEIRRLVTEDYQRYFGNK